MQVSGRKSKKGRKANSRQAAPVDSDQICPFGAAGSELAMSQSPTVSPPPTTTRPLLANDGDLDELQDSDDGRGMGGIVEVMLEEPLNGPPEIEAAPDPTDPSREPPRRA